MPVAYPPRYAGKHRVLSRPLRFVSLRSLMETGAGIEAGPAPRTRDRAPLWIGVVALAGVVAFGAFLLRVAPPEAPDVGEGARVLPVPLEIPDFSLTDHRGQPFDRARLEGAWSLLFFGYTYCPDVCPGTLQRLAPEQDALAATTPAVQVVFVSVDPERDTTDRLAEYVGFFHEDLLGASGEPREVERLTRAVGAFHQKAEGGEELAYLVDHSSSLFLVDPNARLHAVLRDPHETEYYTSLLRRVIAAERSSG